MERVMIIGEKKDGSMAGALLVDTVTLIAFIRGRKNRFQIEVGSGQEVISMAAFRCGDNLPLYLSFGIKRGAVARPYLSKNTLYVQQESGSNYVGDFDVNEDPPEINFTWLPTGTIPKIAEEMSVHIRGITLNQTQLDRRDEWLWDIDVELHKKPKKEGIDNGMDGK